MTAFERIYREAVNGTEQRRTGMTSTLVCREIADALDACRRQGESEDAPEGARYITLSDTFARKLSIVLREL